MRSWSGLLTESKFNEIDSGANNLGKTRPKGILTYGWGPRFILLGLPIQLDFAYQLNPKPEGKHHHWYLTIGLDY